MYIFLVSSPLLSKKDFPEVLNIRSFTFTRKTFPFESEEDPVVYFSEESFMPPELKKDVDSCIRECISTVLIKSSLVEIKNHSVTEDRNLEEAARTLFPAFRKNLIPEVTTFEEVNYLWKTYTLKKDAIRKILKSSGVAFALQQIVDSSKTPVAYELLSRLYDPENDSLIYPSVFIPLLDEERDFVDLFEATVFERFCKIAGFLREKYPGKYFHLNFTSSFLSKYGKEVASVLRNGNSPAVKFEIIESPAGFNTDFSFLEDEFFSKRVVIDDFGEGMSNISLVFNLRVAGIKVGYTYIKSYLDVVNRNFTERNLTKKQEVILAWLVKFLRDVSRFRFFEVFVEGVEDEKGFHRVKAVISPHYYQGFYFGKSEIIEGAP